MTSKKRIHIIIITAISIIFNVIILIFPEITISSAKKGLLLWYNSALPSLLPFIISINILKRTQAPYYISKLLEPITKRLFNITGMGVFPILMGMLSGYPLGMKLSCELYTDKLITRSQAEHLILFTNNSGPLFVIGTVGAIFLKSSHIGYFILFIHYVSAIMIGIITADRKAAAYIGISSPKIYKGNILAETINNSIETIVAIGGYIILFSIITGYITPLISDNKIKAIVYGLFEITGGCSMLSDGSYFSLAFIAALISWGGISIHAQSSAYISKAELPVKTYIFAKAAQALISFVLVLLLYPLYAIE